MSDLDFDVAHEGADETLEMLRRFHGRGIARDIDISQPAKSYLLPARQRSVVSRASSSPLCHQAHPTQLSIVGVFGWQRHAALGQASNDRVRHSTRSASRRVRLVPCLPRNKDLATGAHRWNAQTGAAFASNTPWVARAIHLGGQGVTRVVALALERRRFDRVSEVSEGFGYEA
jgi:hypothetical protein